MIVLERIFYFIVVLGILVFVHELGHFLAAKAFGVRVLTFSLGFGRRIAGFRRGHTDYRLAMIPLGGYVRMAGEIFDEGTSMEPDHFTAKPRWQRVAVYLAGPAMNIVLAIALWWALFASGVPVNTPGGQPVIERVLPGSSADRAGLVAGDRIVAIDGREIEDAQEYGEVIAFGARRSLSYRIERGDATLDLQVEIDAHPVHGVGVDGVITQSPTVVSAVVAGSPAESAGLRAGDRIVLVDEEPVGGSQRFIALVSESAGRTLALLVERDGAEVPIEVTPRADETGAMRIGVALSSLRVIEGTGEAFVEALEMARHNSTLLFDVLGGLIRMNISPKVLSGPLEIARVSEEVAEQGVTPFLLLLAFISMQLGLFNLLPIPVLDGGHIVILVLEMVARREMPMRVKERFLQAGFVFIILFATSVLALDIYKQFVLATSDAGAAAAAPAQTNGAAPVEPPASVTPEGGSINSSPATEVREPETPGGAAGP